MQTTEVIETTPRANGKGRESPAKEPTQWEALCTEGPGGIYPLTPELDILNAHPYHDDQTAFMFREVSNLYRKIQMRYLCRLRLGSAHKLLGAIVTRTLDFRKYAEKISYDQFQKGVKGRDGKWSRDSDGIPIFSGTDLSRSTIVSGLDVLLRGRFIERFGYRRGTTVVYAYMPFHRSFLFNFMVRSARTNFPCDKYEAKRKEHLEMIAGIFSFLEKRWPEDTTPSEYDPDILRFVLDKGEKPAKLMDKDQ